MIQGIAIWMIAVTPRRIVRRTLRIASAKRSADASPSPS